MTSDRYTERGDPDVERSIAALVGEITARARPIEGIEALLIGGSLGRGEGTVTIGPEGPRLASDVEVFLVGRRSSLRSAASQLQADFARRAGPEVSAAWLHPEMLRTGRAKNLSRRPSRTIRLYELGPDATRTLIGSPPDVLPIDPVALPLGEGVRLVLNRLAEANVPLVTGSPEAGRWNDKILMACGDTLLLAAGGYTARYRDRADRIDTLPEPWPMPAGWRAAVVAAYERKLSGTDPGDEAARARTDEVVVATLATAAERVTGEPLEPIASFPRRFVVAGARRPELLRYLPPFGPAARYEAAILAARAWRAGRRPTAVALRQALRGRPLSLALQASALPLYLGIVRRDDGLVRAAAESLAWAGIPRRELDDARDAAALAEVLRRHWLGAT
jgi:hypothetical protein